MNLTPAERRALLMVALVFAISAFIQWVRPHKVSTKQFDYTLQDSLFRALSADTLQKASNAPQAQTSPKRRVKSAKKKKEVLKPKSIDINTANASTLIKLPRIGPKTAQAIIDYRTEHGPFKSIEELDEVKGIGPKTIERLRPFIIITMPDSTGR